MAERKIWRGGYGTSQGQAVLYQGINIFLAALLLCCTAPIVILLAAMVKMRDDGPVFYRGERLGFRKEPFDMYKFRTLPCGTEQKIGAELFTNTFMPLSYWTRFLRDSRLDELPQLFNILRGEMDFVGPRPLRRLVYEKKCQHIHNFDYRFSVRPGLIGYSQLFTPHSSPKKIRAFIDNHLVSLKRNIYYDFYLIAATALAVVRKTISLLFRRFWSSVICAGLLHRYTENRLLERVTLRDAHVTLCDPAGSGIAEVSAMLLDMNETHLKIMTRESLGSHDELDCIMRVRTGLFGRGKAKTARAHLRHFRSLPPRGPHGGYCTVYSFVPLSPLNAYKIDQYFLRKSVISTG